MHKVISIRGLSVSYERKRVLSNIYMDLDAGFIYGVIGPNGAGKSTLFKAILDIIDTNAGAVQVFGSDVNKVRKRIAYIPQKDEVDWNFPALVKDIVLMGRYPHKKILQRLNDMDRSIARDAMEKLGVQDLADRQIGTLSGGQQQRVFIARAICQQADLFFMDEPFVGVDMLTEYKIVEIMKELAIQGKTILVVHHDLSTADDYFDKVILLNQRLIAYGNTSEVFTKQNIGRTYAPQMKILQDIGLIDDQQA